MMTLASRKSVMGEFIIGGPLRVVGWLAVAVMASSAVALAAFSLL
jgi:Mn2+/Fe2+ NRAMP family transporter